MLQACYKFSTCAWFFDKKRRKKKFESNIDSLLIYLFARQEKIEFEFYVLTCKIEEERNNNDFFARGSESKEEMVKFYREARTTDKIPADAANCNYARRSLKRGWEREEHDTRGQTDRERETMIYTVEPFGSCDTLCPWIRASTYNRLTYDYSWKIGGREEYRVIVYVIYDDDVPRVLARHYPLSTNYSLRVNKTSKKGERERKNIFEHFERKRFD